ncbi:MAG TPA: MBL fold metallo-hydrolase [Candidatus Aminicenantes bacterium]|nr:MBL fold metallo-hydrolase [Candidatus Aminicenantes bacterium]
MELTFWGVRGSVPVSGKKYVKYGGHTPCASLFSSDKDLIVIDAGTGIMRLGESLMKNRDKKYFHIHLVFTHFHIDHIMGLPFFPSLFSRETKVSFYSPLKPGETQKLLSTLMGGRFFPIPFGKTGAEKNFMEVPSGDFCIGNVRISHIPLNHPQGSFAYRFSEKGRSILFATDTEHPEEGIDEQLVSLAKKADVFIYDATFTPGEYKKGRKGWGHSTWKQGTRIAQKSGVGKLYLSHFNPSHSDKKIDNIIRNAREVFPETYGAREGATLSLKGCS